MLKVAGQVFTSTGGRGVFIDIADQGIQASSMTSAVRITYPLSLYIRAALSNSKRSELKALR